LKWRWNELRLKRLFGVFIILVTDDHINYIDDRKDKFPKFAYFDKPGIRNILVSAIKRNRPVDLLLEQRQKGKKFDYVIEVTMKGYGTLPK